MRGGEAGRLTPPASPPRSVAGNRLSVSYPKSADLMDRCEH